MIFWNDLYAMMGPMPMWAAYLIVSIILAYTAAVVGVIVGKAGYSPFWGFLAMLPGLAIVMMARIAWGRWKRLPNRYYSEEAG